MESLLREYPITSSEGLALMRLAEALLRVPDAPTAIALTADQLGRAQFDGGSDGPHKMLASLSASAISLSKKFLPDSDGDGGLFTRLGAQTVVAATVRAIQLLGRQFVLGRNINEAMGEADAARRAQSQLRFSYDMPRAARPIRRKRPTASRSSSARCSRVTRCCSASACLPSCCRASGS
jgi:RHH-type proline utilization regulon transcriptional repressor/proline dehydrogenase/delta 1-pyrroline-5-carboxylate dehydrogenase